MTHPRYDHPPTSEAEPNGAPEEGGALTQSPGRHPSRRRIAVAAELLRLRRAEHAARERAERLQELTVALAGTVTSGEVAETVMTAGVLALRAYAGVVATLDPGEAELRILASIGYAAGCMPAGRGLALAGAIPTCEAARTGEPVIVNSTEAWRARFGTAPPPGRSAAWAAYPLRLSPTGPATGAMLWTYDAPREFHADERALMSALARQTAQALERARLHESERAARLAAERALERMVRLQAVTTKLSQALSIEEVAAVVVEEGIEALGAQAGSISLFAPEGDRLEVIRGVGYPPETLAQYRVIPIDLEFPLSDAARTGEPILLATAEERAARYPRLAALRASNGRGAMVAVPLSAHGQVLGALGLNYPEGAPLHAEDRVFIFTLAQQCAQALERARLFEAERRARAEAEEANRAKSQFLSTMSHELRTPLNAIGGYAELMQLGLRGPLTDLQRADLQRIRHSQGHLLTLINDVLHFARLEAGQLELHPEPLAVGRLLSDLETSIFPQLAAKRLDYRCELDPEVLVLADADRVRQILLNLLSNAIKFTPEGGIIRIDSVAGADQVALRVADSGPGIPAEALERVFDPFVQLGRGLTTSHEGTGLGLAISRDLARALGGELHADNPPGGGARFTLSLPRPA